MGLDQRAGSGSRYDRARLPSEQNRVSQEHAGFRRNPGGHQSAIARGSASFTLVNCLPTMSH
jgi:hypothetical protein